MNKKLKILMCSEASFLSSGFGIYTKELLSRLHQTDKYEIAEFASYGFVNDPRDRSIPWRYYANAVKQEDPRYKEYMSRTDNQFGRWRFEKVLMDFKPDVVIDIRDYWMSSYQLMSPLRKFFHWILMPTVDSAPQQDDWIDTFMNADAVFTYSDWGAETILKQSNNTINYVDTTSPGVDLDIFKPLNTQMVRDKYNVPQDAFIIGSVMRNQKRKLIPDLMQSFAKVLKNLKSKNHPLADKTYLYLHTSYPDMGWDIPELLLDTNISKVLFTYTCKSCSNVTVRNFAGPIITCPKCKSNTLGLSSVSNGVNNNTLSEIYNLFDMYVQYAICEGFGMPQVEAGACGVPVTTVKYSAMVDIVKKLSAFPIEVKSYFKELETKAIRAYPDNDQLISHIVKTINAPLEMKQKKKIKVRDNTEKHYNWNDVAKKWEKYLDSLDESGYRANWNPLPPISLNPEIINSDNKSNFTKLLETYATSFNKPDDIGSYRALEWLFYSDYGFIQNGPTTISPYSFMQNTTKDLQTMVGNHNQCMEMLKQPNLNLQDDFIQYANLKQRK
tara:strand:- start:23230 stop:24894 length:1665 start_codon:yes stop_codon:yes gene_type:complete